jgi:hypothetical protein
MTTISATAQAIQHPGDASLGKEQRRHPPLLTLVLLLVASAWLIGRADAFKPGDSVGYWIGVVGSSMMLLLLTYPLRKYARWMQRLGRVKWWFWGHMALGLLGPWLILVHSTFHIGSLNSAVALYSMVVVVASGIVGRFIYMRVHRGLNGERTTLRALQHGAGLIESEARSWLHFAPTVEARLRSFEQRELDARSGWRTYLRQVLVLPWAQRYTYRRCVVELRALLTCLATEQRWSDEQRARRMRRSRKLVERYLDAVVRVAQYTAYERVFSLWHVAHLPFVVLLVVSAIVHVIAVHAY